MAICCALQSPWVVSHTMLASAALVSWLSKSQQIFRKVVTWCADALPLVQALQGDGQLHPASH